MENQENKDTQKDNPMKKRSRIPKRVLKETQNFPAGVDPDSPAIKKPKPSPVIKNPRVFMGRSQMLLQRGVNTRDKMKIDLGKKETKTELGGTKVVAAPPMSRVRKLGKPDSEEGIGLKPSKIPRLISTEAIASTSRQPNPEPVPSTSKNPNPGWCAPQRQQALQKTSFSEMRVASAPVKLSPRWDGPQFSKRQKDIPNVTAATSSGPSCSSSLGGSEIGGNTGQQQQQSFAEDLASSFNRLSCNTAVKDPEKAKRVAKNLARDLFDYGSVKNTMPTSSLLDISGIEPFTDEFSSFSEEGSEYVGGLVDDLIGSAISSSLHSLDGQKFVHSTPIPSSPEPEIEDVEIGGLETEDEGHLLTDSDIW